MITTTEISLDTLSAIKIFHGLPVSALKTVSAATRWRLLPKNTHIFSQGGAGTHVHIVIKGAVRIAQSGYDGSQAILCFIGPGEIFGVEALFIDDCYRADAITLTETFEARWRKSEFLNLLHKYPKIGINLVRIIGKRLQESQERMCELATQRAERRLAHVVLRLASQAGHSTIDGTTIQFPLKRKDVADIAGTTLETACRFLASWEKAGLITTNNRQMTLCRSSEILRIAEDGAE